MGLWVAMMISYKKNNPSLGSFHFRIQFLLKIVIRIVRQEFLKCLVLVKYIISISNANTHTDTPSARHTWLSSFPLDCANTKGPILFLFTTKVLILILEVTTDHIEVWGKLRFAHPLLFLTGLSICCCTLLLHLQSMCDHCWALRCAEGY